MMKYSYALACLLFVFGCGVNTTEEKTDDGLEVKDVRVIDPQSRVSGCYTAILGRDTANFVVQHVKDEQSVFADLEYKNFEKDGSRGSFNGTIEDSLLVGYYKFFSEGVNSVAQAVFKIKGDTLYQAFGDVENRGDTVVFKNLKELQYIREKPFVQRDCE